MYQKNRTTASVHHHHHPIAGRLTCPWPTRPLLVLFPRWTSATTLPFSEVTAATWHSSFFLSPIRGKQAFFVHYWPHSASSWCFCSVWARAERRLAAMAAAKPILYSAWISSCSFRVRIALSLKGNWFKLPTLVSCSTDDGKSVPIIGSRYGGIALGG